MSWLIDNSSWLHFLLICAALGCMAGWWMTRKRAYLFGLGAVAGAAGLIFLLSQLVDTDRKLLVRTLQEMVAAYEQKKLDRTFALIADDCMTEFAGGKLSKAELRARAEYALGNNGVDRIHLWAFEIEKVDPPVAVVFFKAKPFGQWATGSEYCGCRAEFRLGTDGQWRMSNLKIYKPESMELLHRPF
jgi:hypothetical protein